MSNYEIILGIDLGTTFSAAAYVDEKGIVRIIRNAEGDKTTPSVVLIDENGKMIVGMVAVNQAITRRENVIQWIKRSMGEPDYRFQGLSPVEISAEILKKLKADSELELGVPLHKAVITCPAYFSAIEIESTGKAGELAGFEVQEIVREPTAAAVYYGVEHLEEGNKLLVCDLGGGTYDASILSLEGDTFKPLATAGDRQLGGHDWTMDLMDYAVDQFVQVFGEDPRIDIAVEQTLYDICEQVKKDFARSTKGIIPCTYKGRSEQVTVTRDQFEQLTEWRIKQVVMWSEKALEKCDPPLSWDQLDQILLVGGSTRLRRIPEALEQASGIKPVQTAEADTMVAMGAAILAKGSYKPRKEAKSSGIKKNVQSGLTHINFTRRAPRNLGTKAIVRTNNHLEIQNTPIIPYGCDLPAKKIRTDYQISPAGQAFFDIPVVEFDDISEDVILDTWRFTCPPGLPGRTKIHVTFEYDKSGRIDVEAVEQHSKTSLTKQRITYEEPDLEALKMAFPDRNIVFALDVSGSMESVNKIGRAKQAVIDNTRNLINSGHGNIKIGVVAFSSTASVICSLTADTDSISSSVSQVTPVGTTAMGEGINLAIDLLNKDPAVASKEIVLVSDGMPDNPEESLEAGKKAQTAGIKISMLGIGQEMVDEAFMNDISPNYLSISADSNINDAITNLLTLSTPQIGSQSGITWLGSNI